MLHGFIDVVSAMLISSFFCYQLVDNFYFCLKKKFCKEKIGKKS